jgi:hypothetical protein
MRRLLIALIAVGFLGVAPGQVEAFKGASHVKSSGHTASKSRKQKPKKHAAVVTARDSHGRIKRSEQAEASLMRQTGYPHGRPGYVVDHIIPLACGGADAPSNMQWQTVAEAKAKDKTERLSCR